ncbi:hypothetical protein Tsp_08707 [Trichinella spiralis]|uniref:hypothetical protein n=1 Tax=Trichinella spiralis TaxID=6334 RepID=UPI0001EFE123|nr:hypothetical protein Tsp_08707 [Trichinella spiralis]
MPSLCQTHKHFSLHNDPVHCVCLVEVAPNEFVCFCGDADIRIRFDVVKPHYMRRSRCNASQKCRGRFSSDLRALLITDFIRRVSFVNNGWRELKETPSSNRKIPCQAIMFCVSEKRSSSSCAFCIYQSRLA